MLVRMELESTSAAMYAADSAAPKSMWDRLACTVTPRALAMSDRRSVGACEGVLVALLSPPPLAPEGDGVGGAEDENGPGVGGGEGEGVGGGEGEGVGRGEGEGESAADN